MQDILVPSSLKKLLNTKVHIATTSQVKDKLTEYLVWTLTTLCGILKNIGSYAANHEIEFTVCGRKLGGSRELLINRGLNFLAICMANIGVGRTIPTNFYSVLWAQVVGVGFPCINNVSDWMGANIFHLS